MSDASRIITGLVATAVNDVARDPGNPLTTSLAPAVTAAVAAEVAPVLINATNSEPWYQSRVTWGVILAAAGTLAKPFIGDLPIDESQTADIVAALATLGQVVGFVLTLYGRWKAKKPIGS